MSEFKCPQGRPYVYRVVAIKEQGDHTWARCHSLGEDTQGWELCQCQPTAKVEDSATEEATYVANAKRVAAALPRPEPATSKAPYERCACGAVVNPWFYDPNRQEAALNWGGSGKSGDMHRPAKCDKPQNTKEPERCGGKPGKPKRGEPYRKNWHDKGPSCDSPPVCPECTGCEDCTEPAMYCGAGRPYKVDLDESFGTTQIIHRDDKTSCPGAECGKAVPRTSRWMDTNDRTLGKANGVHFIDHWETAGECGLFGCVPRPAPDLEALSKLPGARVMWVGSAVSISIREEITCHDDRRALIRPSAAQRILVLPWPEKEPA